MLAAIPLIIPTSMLAGTAVSAPDNKTQITASQPVEKGAPLPLHTIDGVGGILVTPTAYLVNTSERLGGFAGLPSASASFVGLDSKNIESLVVTETFLKRIEIGYAGSRFGLGSFDNAVYSAAGIHLTRSDVYMNTLNLRVQGLEESTYLPAITAAAQFKWNSGIDTVNNELGRALSSIGYKSDNGVDFTLTATKMIKEPFTLNRPLLLSAGVRFSKAAWLGYVGFGDTYHATVEANAAYSITDWLWLAGEFRQNDYPYTHGIAVNGYNLVKPESNWWTAGAAFILNNHTTATVGYGYFGNLLNSTVKYGWAAQIKYEF